MLPYLEELNLNKTHMDFDATSLYPSAMCDETTFTLKKTGYAF